MTDDKKKNPETEEEFADFEDDFVEGDMEESFHDDGEEFVEEDWESYDEEGDFPVADEGGKKSSKLLVIVGGLVLLGGGGYTAMQFMGGHSVVPQTQEALPEGGDVADALPMPDSGAPGSDNSRMTADDPAANSQNGMSSSLANQDFTPPPSDPELDFEMPMPFSNSNDSEDAETENAGESDVLTPMPQDGEEDETNDMPGLMASGDPAENTQNDSDESEGDSDSNIPAWGGSDSDALSSGEERVESSQSASLDNNALASLESKLESLFNRLDKIESELDRIKNPNSDSDINELQSKIRNLEREMRDMGTRSSSASAGEASSSDETSKNTSSPSKQKPGATHDESAMSAKNWILTSAQPGKATLRNTDSNDVISIEVGDRISGLGRVVSIGLEDSKWVVKATSGRISQ